MNVHWVPKAGNGWRRVIRLALKHSEASFWPPVSGSKDCCFMIRLPLEFRQRYVMAWAVGTVFYAWNFNVYLEWLRASQPYALFPENYKITQLDNKLCQSTRGCPWVFLSECGSPSLTNNAWHMTGTWEMLTKSLSLALLPSLCSTAFAERVTSCTLIPQSSSKNTDSLSLDQLWSPGYSRINWMANHIWGRGVFVQ